MIDTCAVILVGLEGTQPLQARMTFTMGRMVIVEMARSFAVSAVALRRRRPPGRLRIFERLTETMAACGLHWKADDAQQTLAALRATYEPLLDALANRLVLRLPPWISDDDAPDAWQVGHRGLIAARLVEQLSVQASSQEARLPGSLWRRLRARLDS